jgi:hypothetical protein
MGNNQKSGKGMDTYRGINLLTVNWVSSIIGIIAGFILLAETGGYAGIIIIIAIILGIAGHFIITVALAIPFIFLNNGGIPESLKKNVIDNAGSNTSSVEIKP